MKLYDTCTLLNHYGEIFNTTEKFCISNITRQELESIKTSAHKDEQVKYQAKQVTRLLNKYPESYEIIYYKSRWNLFIRLKYAIEINNDIKIMYSAKKHNLTFVTDDRSCYGLARDIMKINVETMLEKTDDYFGYKKIKMSEEQLETFYSVYMYKKMNIYELLENEYLIIIDEDGNAIDKYKWKNGEYLKVNFSVLKSDMFGTIKPIDEYQELAIDSLKYNQVTMLRGRAGSGKSLIALGYLFNRLESGHIDKILIIANPVAAKGAAKLGFLPGDRLEKLLDSQIGNFLMAKFGSRMFVEKLIQDNMLEILPAADIRGVDTTGMRAGLYVTEAQNLDVELMRLILQRVGEDSQIILDGDDLAQVDMAMYAGSNNGMKSASKTFRGEELYGEVYLDKIHRSRIAAIADKMR